MAQNQRSLLAVADLKEQQRLIETAIEATEALYQ